MKKTLLITWLTFIVSPVVTFGQDLPSDVAQQYHLVWQDEFEGNQLNHKNWEPRSLGSKRGMAYVKEENTFLDGTGHCVMQLTRDGDQYFVAQIATHKTYLTRYGYFECRARMNKELGSHVAFWLQSPTVGADAAQPATHGTEIDIFEYHRNGPHDLVHHNLHWGGYGEHHQSAGTTVAIHGIDEGFHTFGLEWLEDIYIFYVDGKETWRTAEAISHIAQYMILSVELTGWGGDPSEARLPDAVVFDYVRVYKKQ